MATVFLIGFAHPEAARLADELVQAAQEHEFIRQDDIASAEVDPENSVAVIWCPGSEDQAAAVIAESMGKGLPTVAVLQGNALPNIDYSAGSVEVAFRTADSDELRRRLEVAWARAHKKPGDNIIRHGELTIDQDRYEVSLSGRKIDLTYKEYELLKYLAARPGRVFNRESLLRAVWDYDYFGGTRTVDVHVRRLRSKINDVRYQFIETVWNVGYRFRAPGDETSDDSQ